MNGRRNFTWEGGPQRHFFCRFPEEQERHDRGVGHGGPARFFRLFYCQKVTKSTCYRRRRLTTIQGENRRKNEPFSRITSADQSRQDDPLPVQLVGGLLKFFYPVNTVYKYFLPLSCFFSRILQRALRISPRAGRGGRASQGHRKRARIFEFYYVSTHLYRIYYILSCRAENSLQVKL